MRDDREPRFSKIRWSVLGLAGYALAGGALTLAGWFANAPRLTDWAGSGIAMFPNTAILAVCAGAALFLLNLGRRWAARASGVLGLFVALLGSANLFQHLTGIDLGIDTLVAHAPWGMKAATAPARMGPPASLSFTLLGVALALTGRGGKGRRLVPILGLVASATATLSLIGYLFGSDPLYSIARWTGIAMQAATMILALGLGIVASAPEREPMRTLLQNSAGGVLARRSLAFIFVAPIAVGWLRIWGQEAGWFDTGMGVALLVLTLIALLCALLWWCVAALAKHEEALQQSESRLAAIIQEMPIGAYLVDADLRLQKVNPIALAVFGSIPNLIGRDLAEVMHILWPKAHAEEVMRLFRHTLESGMAHVSQEWIEQRLDRAGAEYYEWRIVRIPLPDGRNGVVCYFRDISQQVRAREALRQTEERTAQLAAIVEYSTDAVVSKTLDGTITSWNPGAEALFGFSAAEMIGQSIRRIIPPDCEAEEDLVLVRLRAGESVHLDTMRVNIEGRRIPVSITLSPIKNTAGRVIGGSKIARDITEQKRTEEMLREAQRKLLVHAAELEATVAERTAKLRESVNDLQGFSYSIAHDMRAPLRAMGTFAQLLLDEIPPGNSFSTSRDYGGRIVTGARRLDNLINDALNYTRATLQEVVLLPVDLAMLVGGMLDTYPNLQAESADISLDGGLPVVLGNESLLTQCFSNLLENAVKFVAPGTRPKVRVWAETNDGVARIYVQDNGIGIPKHALPRLFAMFQKLDNQYEGTGVGLAIVRKVVERMGGKVGAESEPSRGSRFWVELPVPAKKDEL